MEKVPSAFFNLFMQINATFSKDSSDCIATLSSAAECIEFLVSLPPTLPDSATGDDVPFERTYTMSFAEVREMLGWSPNEENIMAHPLNDLDVLLCVRFSSCHLASILQIFLSRKTLLIGNCAQI